MISVCGLILIQGHFHGIKRECVREGNLVAHVSVDVVGGDVSIITLCALFFLGEQMGFQLQEGTYTTLLPEPHKRPCLEGTKLVTKPMH